MESYQRNNKQISSFFFYIYIKSPNIFNSHFLTLAETLAQSSGFSSDNLACSKSLRDFCNKKLNPNEGYDCP